MVRCPAWRRPSGRSTREHVVWAYRLLLDRDPENEDVIGPKLAGSRDTAELRHHLITSAEFREKNPDFAHTNDPTLVIKEIAPGVAAVHRPVRSRHRPEHPARPVRAGRNPLRARAAEARRHRDRCRRAHRLLHDADGGGGRRRAVASTPSSRSTQRRSARAIDRRERFRRSRRFQRAAVGATAGTATLTFPVETLNSGGAYLLRDGTAPLAGNLKTEVPLVALDALDLPAAGSRHQDGRRRRRAAGHAGRAAHPDAKTGR